MVDNQRFKGCLSHLVEVDDQTTVMLDQFQVSVSTESAATGDGINDNLSLN